MSGQCRPSLRLALVCPLNRRQKSGAIITIVQIDPSVPIRNGQYCPIACTAVVGECHIVSNTKLRSLEHHARPIKIVLRDEYRLIVRWYLQKNSIISFAIVLDLSNQPDDIALSKLHFPNPLCTFGNGLLWIAFLAFGLFLPSSFLNLAANQLSEPFVVIVFSAPGRRPTVRLRWQSPCSASMKF